MIVFCVESIHILLSILWFSTRGRQWKFDSHWVALSCYFHQSKCNFKMFFFFGLLAIELTLPWLLSVEQFFIFILFVELWWKLRLAFGTWSAPCTCTYTTYFVHMVDLLALHLTCLPACNLQYIIHFITFCVCRSLLILYRCFDFIWIIEPSASQQ